jgi:hypothetical protein
MWKIVPYLRPRAEVARRFCGRIDWNGLLLNKQEMLHSIAFKSNRWIDLVGFEMLRGGTSYRISYTITKGQGVLGKMLCKGCGYVPIGDILRPSCQLKLRSPLRIEPEMWYCVNVIIEIHEYEMYLTTSGGTDGRTQIDTDCGVRIEYMVGLESNDKTTTVSGQIAGVSFNKLDPEEEVFLLICGGHRDPRPNLDVSTKDASTGDSAAILPNIGEELSRIFHGPETKTIVHMDDQTSELTTNEKPCEDPTKTTTALRSNTTKFLLPPVAGVISPPIRSQAMIRETPIYK